jgi:hypothetical protein
MTNDVSVKPPGEVRGRPFEKGRSGNPGGRRLGSRNKATLAAAALLAGESEALTRKAVEVALAGDPTALRLCLERLLPPCRDRSVTFRLPPIAAIRREETRVPSPRDITLVMNAVTRALSRGEITPGEAKTIAGAVDTFVQAIKTSSGDGFRPGLLQILTAGDDDEEYGDDDFAEDDEEESGDYYEDADDSDA